jgi:hypothetical protein
MASQSSGVRVMTLPAPKLTPPLAAVPGMMSRLLAPMLAIVFWMASDDPAPISIMAMTAATPMMMPSVVRPALRGFRPRARPSADRPDTSWPSSQYSPEEGWSRQPRMFMRVLLPEPDAPMRAASSPCATASDTPLRTGTSISPRWYVL